MGLVTNPTGVDSHLVSDIDILHNAPNVQLVALYGPEHGVRGSAHAGDAVAGNTDERTHLPVYSLFGKTRVPTDSMLQGIDVLVYDIQDVGCRSFTYISTLYNIMKAAVKHHIKVVVLDRPNPLGGEKMEGNLVEDDCVSFVSQFRVPYVYGLTPGEVALLLNGEGMLGGRCDLTVVKMKGWKRRMTYADTGLPWVLSSPHIPEASTAPFYSITGIIGELTSISIGVGYTLPFKAHRSRMGESTGLRRRHERTPSARLHVPAHLLHTVLRTGQGQGACRVCRCISPTTRKPASATCNGTPCRSSTASTQTTIPWARTQNAGR